ncbi:MAG: hypothetical protein LBJ12_01225 [Oscillospiraceae bacterium]|jgi:hypothetical protein|nr:hypothetical protein [Oscillospiraceae bacterium]
MTERDTPFADIHEQALIEITTSLTWKDMRQAYVDQLLTKPIIGLLLAMPPFVAIVLFPKLLLLPSGVIFILAWAAMILCIFRIYKAQYKFLLKKRFVSGTDTVAFRENLFTHKTKSVVRESTVRFNCDFAGALEMKNAFYLKRITGKMNIFPKAQIPPDKTNWLRGFFAHKFSGKFKPK